VIKLNVGGQLFTTLKSTLVREPNSIFCDMLTKHPSAYHVQDGRYLYYLLIGLYLPTLFARGLFLGL